MNAIVNEHAAHAVYAPSSAHRWMHCTASAEAIAALGEQEEGEEAKEGTEAHDEIERVLGPYSGGGLGLWLERFETLIAPPDPDHAAAYGVALVLDFVRKLNPGTLWIEQRVRLTEHIWGRCDVAHWNDSASVITIVDYKNGYVGVDADAEQLKIYAAASIFTHRLPAKWARLVVVQPNDFRPVPRVKQHIMSADELYRFAERAAAIPLGPKTFTAGEHCTYCPLFGKCSASRDILRDISALVAGLMSPEDVTPEQRALFMACEKPIKDAFKKANKAWTKDALIKGAGPGLKIVTSVGHRKWKDEDAARAFILKNKGVDALDPPTPAQAEKLGLNVDGMTVTPQGAPVLAFESDARKPWVQKSAAEMFAGVMK